MTPFPANQIHSTNKYLMHPNFFHWHSRAEMKPDVANLEARWNAAVKCTEKPSNADICSLIKLVLFPGIESDFGKRFSEALVKAEPTFPPADNSQLLRVMATAAVFHHLASPSKLADALALGLQAANFSGAQVDPICKEVMTRYPEYLAAESERVRPKIYATTLAKAEKQAEAAIGSLKKAVEANSAQDIGKATEALGRGIITAIKESHQQLGDVIGRMSEESQFLWWLIGRRSPALDLRRESLAADAYALPAAVEAAERITVLPPAASIESILDEVLSQCGKKSGANMGPAEVIVNLDTKWVQSVAPIPNAHELTPLVSLVAARPAAGKIDAAAIKAAGLPAKIKFPAAEAARQYFRERVFLRSLEDPR
jgi:hypothetical protein